MQSEAYNSASPDAILLVQAIWPSQFLRKTLKLVKTFCFYTLGEKWSYRKILQQKHRLQYTSGTTKKYNFFKTYYKWKRASFHEPPSGRWTESHY